MKRIPTSNWPQWHLTTASAIEDEAAGRRRRTRSTSTALCAAKAVIALEAARPHDCQMRCSGKRKISQQPRFFNFLLLTPSGLYKWFILQVLLDFFPNLNFFTFYALAFNCYSQSPRISMFKKINLRFQFFISA